MLTPNPSGPMLSLMNKTNNTKRVNTKALRATCPHANVITLSGGVAVCTRCEAVIKVAA